MPTAIKILQTPIAWNCSNDLLWWPCAKTGEYSVRSGYYQIKKNEQRQVSGPSTSYDTGGNMWKRLWKIKVPQKIKHFLWKICHNSIPVLANLWKKKLVNSALCPLCLKEPKTIEHTLLLCEWTRGVWFGLQIQCIPDRSRLSTLHEWMAMKFEEFSRTQDFQEFAISSLCCVLWSIWKERNSAIFEKKEPNPMTTVLRANLIHSDYFSFWSEDSRGSSSQNPPCVFGKDWRPPPKGVLKINTDSSFSLSKNRAHAGIIIRNEEGEVVSGLTKVFPATSPLSAEALSLREALLFAIAMGIQKAIVESDCLDLIKGCRREIKKGEIFGLLSDILCIKTQFQQIGFTWTPREGNQVAHHVASLASRDCLPSNWVLNQPASLSVLIQKEKVIAVTNPVNYEGFSTEYYHDQGSFLRVPEGASFTGCFRSSFPFDTGWCGEVGESSEIRNVFEGM